MPLNSDDCLKLVCTLAEEENLKVTVNESLKGGLIAGIGAVGGGLLGGPPGLAVGATLGSLVAAASCPGFLSVTEVLQAMEPEQKERLAQAVQGIVQGLQGSDALAIVLANQVMKKDVLQAAKAYLENEMKLQIVK